MDKEYRKELKDYWDAVESQLNLLESTPLTDGGTYPWSSEMVDQQLFLQNQIDTIEDLYEEECFSKDFPLYSLNAIIPKGEENSDRTFVLDICDEILGEVSLRRYPYKFLINGEWVEMDVDAYYMGHNLIIEYNAGNRRRSLPNDDHPVVTISYKDFGTSGKIKRDKVSVKRKIAVIIQEYRKN